MIALLDTSESLEQCETELECKCEQLLTPLTKFRRQNLMKWTEKQASMLRRDPVHTISDFWYYEDPDGLNVYHKGVCLGTISVRSVKAYLHRWNRAKQESSK